MNTVCVYHPEDGSFQVYGHDLDESQAKALVKTLHARGVGPDIIPQATRHRGDLAICDFCQEEVTNYYFKQRQAQLLSRPPEKPLLLGQGSVSSQIEGQGLIDRSQGAIDKLKHASPYLLGIVLLVLVLALGANPIAQKVTPALQSLLHPNPQVTNVAVLPQGTTEFVFLAESQPTPTVNQASFSVATETSQPASVFTATPLPSATPLPPTATSLSSPTPAVASGCIPATQVSLAEVGKDLCITGAVARTFEKEGIFYVAFDDQRGSLYLVSYEGAGKNIKAGDCLIITGPVKQVGTRPVILLTWAMEIQTCP